MKAGVSQDTRRCVTTVPSLLYQTTVHQCPWYLVVERSLKKTTSSGVCVCGRVEGVCSGGVEGVCSGGVEGVCSGRVEGV